MEKLTTEEFIRKARAVHGDWYDYSRVEYINFRTPICIICPIHGEFWMTPKNHLCGCKCQECAKIQKGVSIKNTRRTCKRKLVYGLGINDKNVSHEIYKLWNSMFQRCYSPKIAERYPTYKDCEVCQEWLILSNFAKWVNNSNNGYQKGYCLDKDIIEKGNKMYSPDTCCFVPQEINKLFIKADGRRGEYPIGVSKDDRFGKFKASIKMNSSKRLGTFDTPEEAFVAYKTAKESYIKEIANEYYYNGRITKRVYDALMRYEVEITD